MIKRILILLTLFLASVSFAQRAINVSRQSRDYRKIIAVLTPVVRTQAAGPIRLTGDVVRRAGSWAFVRSGIKFINPKMVGDGEAMALLRLRGSRWTIVEETVGSGGMEDMADEWRHKHHTPAGLIPKF